MWEMSCQKHDFCWMILKMMILKMMKGGVYLRRPKNPPVSKLGLYHYCYSPNPYPTIFTSPSHPQPNSVKDPSSYM